MTSPLRSAGRALAVCAAAAAASAFVPQSSSAAVSCQYLDAFDWAIVTLDAAGDFAHVQASPDTRLLVNDTQCGGATLLNTDTISVTDQSTGDTWVDLDGAQASFAPGVTDEDPGPDVDVTSEIEIQVSLGTGTADTLFVDGHNVGSSMVAGAQGVNLNAGAEAFGPDADVTLSGVEQLDLRGGDSADWLSGQGGAGTGQPFEIPLWIAGRQGDDELYAGEHDMFPGSLDGGAGDDVLVGGANGSRMRGGPGDDTLTGGPGPNDEVSYENISAGVHVDLASTGPQDTGAGGTDTITHVEGLMGSPFDDVLVGDAAANFLTGRKGDDVLDGRGGIDHLEGEQGADVLRPGPGDGFLDGGDGDDTATFDDVQAPVTVDLTAPNYQDTGGAGTMALLGIENLAGSPFADRLTGTAGPNAIDGGAGPDTITGGAGADRLLGSAGDDAIDSADGAADQVACGGGNDALTTDALDVVAADCAPPAPGGGGSGPSGGGGTGSGSGSGTPPAALAFDVRVRRSTLGTALRRGLRTRMRCNAACGATARLRISRATARRLGLGTSARARTVAKLPAATLAANTDAARRLRFTRRAAHALRHAKRVRLALRARATGAGGAHLTVKRTFTLRAGAAA